MKQTRKFSLLAFSLFILLAFSPASAQQPEQVERNYEITLNVLIGSNEAGQRAELPPHLSSISRQLKANFSFANYRVVNTFFGRVSNTGNLEYKSVSNILGQEAEAEAHTFLEWTLAGFRATPNGFQARTFRFGARIAVRIGKVGEGGLVYEPIGLTVSLIGFPANTPTLIGNISLPKTTGTIFLVVTIRPVEMQ